MRKTIYLSIVVLIVAVSMMLIAGSALASTVLWYGGDDAYSAAVQSFVNPTYGNNSNYPAIGTYDDFNLTSKSTITDIFSTSFWFTRNNVVSTQAEWVVRSGMSANSAGSVVATGTSTEQLTDVGAYNGYNLKSISLDVPDFTLDAGTYWLTIMPIVSSGSGSASVAVTHGTNGIGSPLKNGNSFQLSGNSLNRSFSVDFTYGVKGNPVSSVPEPATLLGFGIPMLMIGLGKLKGLRN